MKSMNHLRREHRHLQYQHHHNLGLVAMDAQAKKAEEPSRARHPIVSDNGAAVVDDTAGSRAHRPRRVNQGCYSAGISNLASFQADDDFFACLGDPNHPNRTPTLSPTAAPTVSDPELPPGAIAGLIIFGVFVFGLTVIYNLANPTPPPPSSSPPIPPRPAGGNAGRWQTTSTQTAPHGHPFNRPTDTTTTPTRPTTAHNSTQEQAMSPHQQAVNLVKSMTRSERRAYVANFLHTQKYVEPDDTETTAETTGSAASNSAKFVVSQSTRILNSKASEPSTAAPSCAICLDEFEDGEDVCSSQNAHCPHQFHLTCAFEWLLSSQECPCCRRDYLTIGQVLSSRRVVSPTTTTTTTTGTATATAPTTTGAPPESAPTAPMESDLPVESELPVEAEVEILPVAAEAVTAAPNNRVENALTPQEILRRSVPPERLDV